MFLPLKGPCKVGFASYNTGVLRSLNARALTQISLMISLVPWLTFRLGNLTLWIWWPMVCLLWNFEFFVCFLFPPASACAIQPTEHTTIVQCAFSKPVMLQIIDIGSSYCRARYLSLDLSSVDYLALFTLHLHCLQLILHSVFDVQLFKTLHYLWATNAI